VLVAVYAIFCSCNCFRDDDVDGDWEPPMISEFYKDNLFLAIYLFCYFFLVGYFTVKQYLVSKHIFLLTENKSVSFIRTICSLQFIYFVTFSCRLLC